MFDWLRSALDRGRAAMEVKQIAARMDQIEFEWTDVLDKLKAREDRERKRKKTDVVQATYELADGPTEVPVPNHPGPKVELWKRARKNRSAS